MGHNISYEFINSDDNVSDNSSSEDDHNVHIIEYTMLARITREESPPIIRKKPDLSTFRHTMLYKEIKALSGFPANSKKPNERLCLPKCLMKRENGLPACKYGTFSPNQQRRIANFFVPNKKVDRLMSLNNKVYICKFNTKGDLLITASQDGTVRLFKSITDTYYRKNRCRLQDINWNVLDVDFSPCRRSFTYSTWTNAFYVKPIEDNGNSTEVERYEFDAHVGRCGIFSVRFAPCDSGRTIVGGCTNSNIFKCDRETRHISSIRIEDSVVDVNALSYVSDRDPNLIVSGCHNGVIKLWDLRCTGDGYRTSKPESVFLGHFDGITYIDPRNDGHYILSNSKDQSIKIWDLRHPTPSNKVPNIPRSTPRYDWDYRYSSVPREYYNPQSLLDGDVSVMTYRGHRVTKTLLRAKFSPAIQTGQRYIYTGCSTGRIIIYDVLTGHIKEAIESHRYVIRDLHWHPIRAEIVSGSFDSQVNINRYKYNPNLKKNESDKIQKPLRRSRRIAQRAYEEEDDENYF